MRTSCSRVLRQNRCSCSWNWSIERSVDRFSNSARVIWHRCEPVAADPWRTVSLRENYCVEHGNQLRSRYSLGLLTTKCIIEYKLLCRNGWTLSSALFIHLLIKAHHSSTLWKFSSLTLNGSSKYSGVKCGSFLPNISIYLGNGTR